MKIENKIQEGIVLAPFTTFNIGGAAKYYLEAENKEDIECAYKWAKEKEIKVYILGGGSNVLIPDIGVDGLVIRPVNINAKIMGERVECGAGIQLRELINKCAGNNISGLEWASGIPRATIGGAIRGNAEAFNEPISSVVETVDVLDSEKMIFRLYSNRDCCFEYRNSIFKKIPI
jgi:UDP-N-acetylmuramate dehydrogenase